MLKIDQVSKMYGDNLVLDDVSLEVRRGERIAIIGPNGIGKSTFLKICMDEVDADQGSTHWGHETHLGYFEQDNDALFSGDSDLQSWLWDTPSETMGFVRGKLAEVLFTQDDADKRVVALSGGEKARMVSACSALDSPMCWSSTSPPTTSISKALKPWRKVSRPSRERSYS